MIFAHTNEAVEWELAREVQARLFPRKKPKLHTLNYTGVTQPAGHLGGDYFDFLDLGRGFLGLAVGDIAGKGTASALLMASLQATLRSQCVLALDDIGSLLRSVNRAFCENTPDAAYATLFFAEYNDRSRQLRYVNCGHPRGLLLHADGTVGHLEPTATVLGIWQDWDCSLGEVQLAFGDSLLLYTDGVTEARNHKGEEFGEAGLLELIRNGGTKSASELIQFIVSGLQGFLSSHSQQDDITVVAARCARQ